MVIFEYQYSYIKTLRIIYCFPHQIISNASLINVKISNIIKKSCKRTFPHIFLVKKLTSYLLHQKRIYNRRKICTTFTKICLGTYIHKYTYPSPHLGFKCSPKIPKLLFFYHVLVHIWNSIITNIQIFYPISGIYLFYIDTYFLCKGKLWKFKNFANTDLANKM